MSKRFRKVYLVVQDNQIFTKYNYEHVAMYRREAEAERMCQLANQNANTMPKKWYQENLPAPVFKVHAFYLMHEGWFEKD